MVIDVSLEQAFWDRLEVRAPRECWPWVGVIDSKGYGQFIRRGVSYRSHRLSYEILIAPIPDGLVIDHLCRNKNCSNPSHLEPVTQRENVLRGLKGRLVTECLRGHPYTPENTLNKSGRRNCKECNRIRMARAYHARKVQIRGNV